MANTNKRITALSNFDGDRWGDAVPIGAEAKNVDVKVNDHETPGTIKQVSLQSIIGTRNDNDDPIATQISTLSTRIGNNKDDITNIKNFINAFTENMVERDPETDVDNWINFDSN